MTNKKTLMARTQTAVLILWPTSVMAAANVAQQDPFHGITWTMIAVLLLMSTASGLTSLLLRLYLLASKSSSPEINMQWLLVSSHMAAAWLAGMLAFGMSKHFDSTFWETMIAVILTSFAGAQFIEKLLASRMGALVGGTPSMPRE